MGRSSPLEQPRRRRGAWCAAALVAAPLLFTHAVVDAAASSNPSAAEGQRIFETRCAVCHSTEPEYHKEGPSLAGAYGRRAGTAPFFPRYRGLTGSQVVWNDETLDAWLADPRAFLGGRATAMTFKLSDPEERAAVIAYLRTLR